MVKVCVNTAAASDAASDDTALVRAALHAQDGPHD